MKATLYLPGCEPQQVNLGENTREAAARLLGVPPVVVFPMLANGDEPCGVDIYSDGVLYDGDNHNPAAEFAAECLLGSWCDFHGRILIIVA
jgi:hypothetical protein